MKGLLPRVLYQREKFAFMAPPAHTDEHKWDAMKRIADDYLADSKVKDAALLDRQGISDLFAAYQQPDTSAAGRVQRDAMINHMIGIQVLHEKFVAADIPSLAKTRAAELGLS
jgi:asparagine synthase (glutamine-hydrolysing)